MISNALSPESWYPFRCIWKYPIEYGNFLLIFFSSINGLFFIHNYLALPFILCYECDKYRANITIIISNSNIGFGVQYMMLGIWHHIITSSNERWCLWCYFVILLFPQWCDITSSTKAHFYCPNPLNQITLTSQIYRHLFENSCQ